MLTEQLDLRGGRNCWRQPTDEPESDEAPTKADVAIIGAGVMGAMVAERLSDMGVSVVVLDRRAPATGATAASTALVMWGADVPLTHLSQTVGENEAAERWRRVFGAVRTLDQRILTLDIECGWRARPELYLAGDVLDDAGLKLEADARARASLPSEFLAAEAVHERFDIAPRSALLSSGSYEADPVALTLGLIKAARANGAKLCFPFDVIGLAREAGGVRVRGNDGADLLAKSVVLASGYEAARLFLPQHFSLSSSYAIASKPGAAPAWRENALLWEAADPYLYARATSDGRIIVGGEDEEFVDAIRRDALIPAKSGTLQAKAAKLIGRDDIEYDCAWAASFGGSPDGLPAIGAARNMDDVTLAYGFGGNGVTFASLGAELIAARMRGEADAAARFFDPYRAL